MHRKQNLSRAESLRSQRIAEISEGISEKGQRSSIARKRHEDKIQEKKFKEFLVSQDKKLNIERIARQQQFDRDMLDLKIQEDNNRSIRIKREREEIFNTKQKLRKDIDKDKQAILNDFDLIKQGKVEPDEVAKKYGYTAQPRTEKSEREHHNSRANLGRQTLTNSSNRVTKAGTNNWNNTSGQNASNTGGSGVSGTRAEQRQEEQRRRQQQRDQEIAEMKRRHVDHPHPEQRAARRDRERTKERRRPRKTAQKVQRRA